MLAVSETSHCLRFQNQTQTGNRRASNARFIRPEPGTKPFTAVSLTHVCSQPSSNRPCNQGEKGSSGVFSGFDWLTACAGEVGSPPQHLGASGGDPIGRSSTEKEITNETLSLSLTDGV